MPGHQTLKSISLYLWDCCAPRPQKPVTIFCVVNRLKMLSHTRIQLLHSKFTGIWQSSCFYCLTFCVQKLTLNVFFLSLQMLNLILNWRTLPRSGSHWSGKSFGSLHFSHLLGGGSRSNLSLKWLKGNNGDFAPCSAACFRPNQQWILTRSRWLCLKSAIWWTI